MTTSQRAALARAQIAVQAAQITPNPYRLTATIDALLTALEEIAKDQK